MWTKNGGRTLSHVLRRIAEVIPPDAVKRRLVIDDRSTDDTREIAESFGWLVFLNEGKGISDGANTALKLVETELFISFEQDLLLAEDWWKKVPRLLLLPKIAVASGIRFVHYPLALRKIEEFSAENYMQQDKLGNYFPLSKTIDNTIYKTKAIRSIGGFPSISGSVGVDQALSQKIYQSGLRWRVNYNVHSIHLRNGLKEELNHNYWYGTRLDELNRLMFKKNASAREILLKFLYSPVRGLEIAIKKRAPESVYIYPMMRHCYLRGVIDSRRRMQA